MACRRFTKVPFQERLPSFETCPTWVPAMDTGQQFARIALKRQRATIGSITLPIGPQKFETCPDWGANSKPPEPGLPNRLREDSLRPVFASLLLANFRKDLRVSGRARRFSVSRRFAWGPSATLAVAVESPSFLHRTLRFSV